VLTPQLTLILQLGAQAVLISILLLILFRLRSRFGLSLLFITLGAFQQMQETLALSFYVEVAPGLLVSPGSIILFTGGLFALLLIYIREDASEARNLIYGLVVANLFLAGGSHLFSAMLDSTAMHNLHMLPREILRRDPRIIISGSLALLVDGVLLIVVYEWVSRHVSKFLFLRIYLSMTVVLVLDTVIFATGSFLGGPQYLELLLSAVSGKIAISLFYASVLTIYLRVFEKSEYLESRKPAQIQDIFEILTYKQKYEVLRERVVRDGLTGLYNRAFFEDILPAELVRSFQLGKPLALLMIDVDHFKQYNDTHGHTEGDRVLQLLAATLLENLRSADMPCRYGGEEFAVILPDCDGVSAAHSAERIREKLLETWLGAAPPHVGGPVTITVGIGVFPAEAGTVNALVRLADERLYRGKREGRNRVVGGVPLFAGSCETSNSMRS
jgi:diguanylate cyclase (GGDEF)-like protein